MVRIMKTILRNLSVAAMMAFIFIITAIPVSAEAPSENGSPAKAAMLDELQPVKSQESNAMPQWLLFSGIGAVVVIGVIAGAVALGNNQEEDTSDIEE